MILIAACAKEEAPVPVDEKHFDLEQVIAAIESETAGLAPFGILGTGWNLNHVSPNVYSLEPRSAEHEEFVYVYIFDSEASRQVGMNETAAWDTKNMIQFPVFYETNNVGIVYLSDSKEAPYKEQIQQALEKM